MTDQDLQELDELWATLAMGDASPETLRAWVPRLRADPELRKQFRSMIADLHLLDELPPGRPLPWRLSEAPFLLEPAPIPRTSEDLAPSILEQKNVMPKIRASSRQKVEHVIWRFFSKIIGRPQVVLPTFVVIGLFLLVLPFVNRTDPVVKGGDRSSDRLWSSQPTLSIRMQGESSISGAEYQQLEPEKYGYRVNAGSSVQLILEPTSSSQLMGSWYVIVIGVTETGRYSPIDRSNLPVELKRLPSDSPGLESIERPGSDRQRSSLLQAFQLRDWLHIPDLLLQEKRFWLYVILSRVPLPPSILDEAITQALESKKGGWATPLLLLPERIEAGEVLETGVWLEMQQKQPAAH